MHFVRFIVAFVVYTVIGIGWNFSPIAQNIDESLYEASGNSVLFESFGKQPDTWGWE